MLTTVESMLPTEAIANPQAKVFTIEGGYNNGRINFVVLNNKVNIRYRVDFGDPVGFQKMFYVHFDGENHTILCDGWYDLNLATRIWNEFVNGPEAPRNTRYKPWTRTQ